MKARIEFSDIPKGLMSVMISTESYLGKTGFDIKLVELIQMRVSGINAWNRLMKSFGIEAGNYQVGQF